MVEWIIMQIHHARQSRRESKSVLDAAVSVQPHQSVPLRDIMQKTDFQKSQSPRISGACAPLISKKGKRAPPQKKKCYLFLSLAKKVSGLVGRGWRKTEEKRWETIYGHSTQKVWDLRKRSLHPNLVTEVATECEDDVFFFVCESQPLVSPILIEAQC